MINKRKPYSDNYNKKDANNNIIEFPQKKARLKIKETPVIIKSISNEKNTRKNASYIRRKKGIFTIAQDFITKKCAIIINKFYSPDEKRTRLKEKNNKPNQDNDRKNGGGGIPPRPILMIILCAVLIFISAWSFMRKNAQEVYIAREKIGIVKTDGLTEKEFKEAILEGLEKKEGAEVLLSDDIVISPVNSSKENMVPIDTVVDKIYNKLAFKVKSSTLKVNGEEVAIFKTKLDAKNTLDSILNSYKKEGIEYIKEPTFVEKISIDDKFVEEREIQKNEDIKAELTKNTKQGKKYTIKEGDTLYEIAIDYNISLEELMKVNPQLTETSMLKIGSEINLVVPVPFLSVRTYEKNIYEDMLPKKVEYVKNNKEYKTYKKTLVKGNDGIKQVTAELVRLNGIEEDKKIISEKVIKEPTVEKIEVGTLKTPPKKAVGNFIYPINGRITSGYGPRWGSSHKAIDLAASAGTPIKASDGGVVVEVKTGGWNGGYGNMVKIDHKNGYKTVYAHNSKNNVVVGQKVAQGEVIAYVGSTGDSTGNHVHFEIIENGVKKNPINYLR